jgi:hypothetical protein
LEVDSRIDFVERILAVFIKEKKILQTLEQLETSKINLRKALRPTSWSRKQERSRMGCGAFTFFLGVFKGSKVPQPMAGFLNPHPFNHRLWPRFVRPSFGDPEPDSKHTS